MRTARLEAAIRRITDLARSAALFATIALAPITAPLPAQARCGTVVVPVGLGQGGGSDITSLNPLLILSAYNAGAWNLLFRPLVTLDAQLRVDLARSMASRIERDPSGLVWTITLRETDWSDGVPVTADDVVYGFELIRRLGQTYNSYGAGGLPDAFDAVVATDAHTLRVTLKQPLSPALFTTVALPLLHALPRHAWKTDSIDVLWSRQSDPHFYDVVDGAWRLERWTLGRELVLVPNDRYAGPDRPQIDRFVMSFLDNDQMLAAYRSGAVDAINMPYLLYDAVRHLPDTTIERGGKPYAYSYIGLNFANPRTAFFRDLSVRQAIADAIDQREIIDLIFHGNATPAYGPVPSEPDTFLSPEAKSGHLPVGYDPAHARALLDAAGWHPGPDGIRVKDGTRLAFTTLLSAGGGVGAPQLEIIEQNLRAVGIELHIHQVQFNQLLATVNGPSTGWEAYNVIWNLTGFPDGADTYSSTGFNNLGHYHDAEMDRLTAAERTDPTLDSLFAFQDRAVEQQPIIVLPHYGYAILARSGVTGWSHYVTPLGGLHPEALRITDPRRCTANAPDRPL
jgi:peptide/nickel transport system substrate-binding protein